MDTSLKAIRAILFVVLLCIDVSPSVSSVESGLRFKIRPEYIGTWTAPENKITVRTEPKKWHFEFTPGKADFSMTIRPDKTVSGHIGKAIFENGRLEKNWGLPPSWTGVIYVVVCGKMGKIFDNDPLKEKELEIWIGPIKHDGTIEVDIRYGLYPMGGFLVKKI